MIQNLQKRGQSHVTLESTEDWMKSVRSAGRLAAAETAHAHKLPQKISLIHASPFFFQNPVLKEEEEEGIE